MDAAKKILIRIIYALWLLIAGGTFVFVMNDLKVNCGFVDTFVDCSAP